MDQQNLVILSEAKDPCISGPMPNLSSKRAERTMPPNLNVSENISGKLPLSTVFHVEHAKKSVVVPARIQSNQLASA
jgi:hypothetical protein